MPLFHIYKTWILKSNMILFLRFIAESPGLFPHIFGAKLADSKINDRIKKNTWSEVINARMDRHR